MSLTENQNDIGKAVRKVLNKPAEDISIIEDDDSQNHTSTPRESKHASKRKRTSKAKPQKKHRYAFTSSDESVDEDQKSQAAESAASTIDEDEFDQMVE